MSVLYMRHPLRPFFWLDYLPGGMEVENLGRMRHSEGSWVPHSSFILSHGKDEHHHKREQHTKEVYPYNGPRATSLEESIISDRVCSISYRAKSRVIHLHPLYVILVISPTAFIDFQTVIFFLSAASTVSPVPIPVFTGIAYWRCKSLHSLSTLIRRASSLSIWSDSLGCKQVYLFFIIEPCECDK